MKRRKKRTLYTRMLRTVGVMMTMCLLLTSIGVHFIFAANTALTKGDLIPGSVTIDSPKALSEVALPKSDYGTLKWTDGKKVPSSYSTSYKVIFTASSDCKADFSKVEGWDSATRSVTGSVTVFVKSLAPAEPEKEASETPEATQAPQPEETPVVTETPEVTETPAAEPTAEPTTAPEKDKAEATVTPVPEEATENLEDHFKDKDEHSFQDSEAPVKTPADTQDSDSESKETEEKPTTPVEGEKMEAPSDTESFQEPDGSKKEESIETSPKGDKIQEAPLDEVVEQPMETPMPESPMDLVEEEVRPVTVSEDMNPEEQAAVAAENHTCRGITVSGAFLPWYVQFRVYDGSGFAFTNAEDASVFQAYEFQLWDMLHDVEYTIPEGETIQVTMPAIEGYEYTIQHIRPDGTTETIVPIVYGSTMVFATDSFSPFGIAGSKPLVGGNIADNGYGSGGASTTPKPSTGNGSTGTSSSVTTAPSVSSGSNGSSQSSTGSSQVSSGSTSQSKASSSTTSTVKVVKTGDDTNVMPFVIIGLGALLVIIAIALSILNKKRK